MNEIEFLSAVARELGIDGDIPDYLERRPAFRNKLLAALRKRLSRRKDPFAAASQRIVANLLRHRERYAKAWIAVTGLHPAQLVLQERTYPCDDGVIRTEVRIVPIDDAV